MCSRIQISDFGLAVTNGMHGKNNIKLSGTLGYVAPEYLLDGKTFAFPIYFLAGSASENLRILNHLVKITKFWDLNFFFTNLEVYLRIKFFKILRKSEANVLVQDRS